MNIKLLSLTNCLNGICKILFSILFFLNVDLNAQNRWSNNASNGVFDTTNRKGAVIIGNVNFNRATPVSDTNFVFLTGYNSSSPQQLNTHGTRWGLIANGKLGFNRQNDRWLSFGDRLPWESNQKSFNSIGMRSNWGKYNANFGTIYRNENVNDAFISWQDSTVFGLDSSLFNSQKSKFRILFRNGDALSSNSARLFEYFTIFPNGVVNVGNGLGIKPNAKLYVESGNVGSGHFGQYGIAGADNSWTNIGKSPFTDNDIGFRAQSGFSGVILTATKDAPFNVNGDLIWSTSSSNSFDRSGNGLQFKYFNTDSNLLYNAMTLRYSRQLKNGFLGVNVINPDARLDVRSTGDGNEANRGTYVVRSLQQWAEDFNYNTFLQNWGCLTKALVISGPYCNSNILTENFVTLANGKTGIRTAPDDSFSLKVDGIIRASQFSQSSDFRFKENIKSISNPIDLINKINSYKYNYKQNLELSLKNGNGIEIRKLTFPSGSHFGYIAQEMQEILPEVVIKDQDGYLSVDYMQLIPVITEVLKIQNSIIDSLALKIAVIEKKLSIERLDESTDKLFQNVPNPINNSSIIAYELKQDGLIIFTKLDGTTIKTFEVKGTGFIELDGNLLEPGIYYYSLIVKDRLIETRTLIKS